MKLNVKANLKNKSRNRWMAGAMLLFCAVLTQASFSSGGQTSQSVKRGNDSSAVRERIVNDVEPFCRALVPDHDTLRFQVSQLPVYTRAGVPSSYWVVECFNTANKEIVHAVWNDDAKKMFSMSLILHTRAKAVPPSKEQAGVSARRWLTNLNMASQTEALAGSGKIALLGNIWRVDLRLSVGRAIVWINARSGDLEHIMVREGEGVLARAARASARQVALHDVRLPVSGLAQRAVPILPPASMPDA